jgi:hypothetical protein
MAISGVFIRTFLLQNYFTELHQTQEHFFGDNLLNLLKEIHFMQNSGCHGNQMKKLK